MPRFDHIPEEDTMERLVADLKAKLAARKARVLDMFRIWDADQDGRVSVKEFHRAVKKLNLGFSEEVVEALYSTMDDDGSGQLDFDEINLMLTGTKPRRETLDRLRASKAKMAKLAEVNAKSLQAARAKATKDATDEDVLLADLSAKLAARRCKIIDCMKSWDADGNGQALKRVRPRRDTVTRLKISKARVAAMPPQPFRVGFASACYKKSFAVGGKSAFGSNAKRDKYTSWVAARSGLSGTPVQVGPGRYPAIVA